MPSHEGPDRCGDRHARFSTSLAVGGSGHRRRAAGPERHLRPHDGEHRRHQRGVRRRRADLRATRRAVPRAHRGVRRGGSEDQRGARAERGGAGDRARARRRAQGEGSALAAARHSGARSRTSSTRPTCRRPAATCRSKGVMPTHDATIVEALREAGAIILAKVNQSDWYANPDIMASSTLGGSTLNPFALDRTPGWSSAGTGAGLAAHFGTVGLGSETGFSIRTPTSDSNLFGLSTTSGLISRAGQMWSYITGERGGPMAHSVYDLAATLDVIAGFDSADLWTANSLGKMPLRAVRQLHRPGRPARRARRRAARRRGTSRRSTRQVIELAKQAIAVFGEHGAQVFDPVVARHRPAELPRGQRLAEPLRAHPRHQPVPRAARARVSVQERRPSCCSNHAGVPGRERDRELHREPDRSRSRPEVPRDARGPREAARGRGRADGPLRPRRADLSAQAARPAEDRPAGRSRARVHAEPDEPDHRTARVHRADGLHARRAAGRPRDPRHGRGASRR